MRLRARVEKYDFTHHLSEPSCRPPTIWVALSSNVQKWYFLDRNEHWFTLSELSFDSKEETEMENVKICLLIVSQLAVKLSIIACLCDLPHFPLYLLSTA